MPNKQLQVRGLDPDEYEDSLDALRRHPNPPNLVTGTLKLKGSIEGATLAAVEEIASRHGLELELTLTASWEEGEQLRLFSPRERIRYVDRATGEVEDEGEEEEFGPEDDAEESTVTIRAGDREVTVTGDELAGAVDSLEELRGADEARVQ